MGKENPMAEYEEKFNRLIYFLDGRILDKKKLIKNSTIQFNDIFHTIKFRMLKMDEEEYKWIKGEAEKGDSPDVCDSERINRGESQ